MDPSYLTWDRYYWAWAQSMIAQYLTFHPSWGTPQNLVFDKFSQPSKDRGDFVSSGRHGAAPSLGRCPNRSHRFQNPVRPVLSRKSNSSHKQVWRVKITEKIGSSSQDGDKTMRTI